MFRIPAVNFPHFAVLSSYSWAASTIVFFSLPILLYIFSGCSLYSLLIWFPVVFSHSFQAIFHLPSFNFPFEFVFHCSRYFEFHSSSNFFHLLSFLLDIVSNLYSSSLSSYSQYIFHLQVILSSPKYPPFFILQFNNFRLCRLLPSSNIKTGVV